MSRSRTLHLLRHAKSSWQDATVPDLERPLAARGERAGVALARYFREHAVFADLVLCSPSVRTRQTWARVSDGLPDDPTVVFDAAIYEASAGDLLTMLHGVDKTVDSVLLIGHNPGIGALADGLADDGDQHALRRLREGFPTGGFATLSLGMPWTELTWDGARLDRFVRPRDLPA